MLWRTLIYALGALLFLLGMRYGTMPAAHRDRQRGVFSNSAPPARPAPPGLPLAPTLPASDFPGNPVAQHAYATAAKIEPLLSQLPSECGNNPSHVSLLRCFQNRQASQCGACQREDYYAYEESCDGKSARQIRLGILKGAWRDVNLSRWKAPLLVKIAAVR